MDDIDAVYEADIVERLRAGTNGVDAWCESVSEMVGYWHPLADEAADEIEQLRAEVERLRDPGRFLDDERLW
jgi:HAMP domain-containing protein